MEIISPVMGMEGLKWNGIRLFSGKGEPGKRALSPSNGPCASASRYAPGTRALCGRYLPQYSGEQ